MCRIATLSIRIRLQEQVLHEVNCALPANRVATTTFQTRLLLALEERKELRLSLLESFLLGLILLESV